MLELDSAIDDGLFSGFGWVRDLYIRYSAFMRRFRVLGWQRIPVELANETLTWGAVGMLLMLGLAQPAILAPVPIGANKMTIRSPLWIALVKWLADVESSKTSQLI